MLLLLRSNIWLNQVLNLFVSIWVTISPDDFFTSEQFAPGNASEVLITSADSQIRVFDGLDMVHKFRGKTNGI